MSFRVCFPNMFSIHTQMTSCACLNINMSPFTAVPMSNYDFTPSPTQVQHVNTIIIIIRSDSIVAQHCSIATLPLALLRARARALMLQIRRTSWYFKWKRAVVDDNDDAETTTTTTAHCRCKVCSVHRSPSSTLALGSEYSPQLSINYYILHVAHANVCTPE